MLIHTYSIHLLVMLRLPGREEPTSFVVTRATRRLGLSYQTEAFCHTTCSAATRPLDSRSGTILRNMPGSTQAPGPYRRLAATRSVTNWARRCCYPTKRYSRRVPMEIPHSTTTQPTPG